MCVPPLFKQVHFLKQNHPSCHCMGLVIINPMHYWFIDQKQRSLLLYVVQVAF